MVLVFGHATMPHWACNHASLGMQPIHIWLVAMPHWACDQCSCPQPWQTWKCCPSLLVKVCHTIYKGWTQASLSPSTRSLCQLWVTTRSSVNHEPLYKVTVLTMSHSARSQCQSWASLQGHGVDHEPLYRVTVSYEPLSKVTANHEPFYKVTVNHEPFYKVTVNHEPLYKVTVSIMNHSTRSWHWPWATLQGHSVNCEPLYKVMLLTMSHSTRSWCLLWSTAQGDLARRPQWHQLSNCHPRPTSTVQYSTVQYSDLLHLSCLCSEATSVESQFVVHLKYSAGGEVKEV